MVKVMRELKATEYNGIKENKTVEFYQDGNYNDLLMGFKRAIDKHNTSVVAIFDGRSGMGKTTLAIQTATTLDKNFGLHKP